MPTLQQLKDAVNDPRLQEFIGKWAIVCLCQFYQDDPVDRDQLFGEIVGIEDGMMALQTKSKRSYFPIALDVMVAAPRGKYTLDATGEEIINPDFLVSWRLDLQDHLEDSKWTANTAPHFATIVGREWEFEYTYDRSYLEELIRSRGDDFIGKTILIGISEYGYKDNGERTFIKRYQQVGKVDRLSLQEGIVVRLKDGSEETLPPDLSMIQKPPLGEYTLQSSGELIVNPDLMTTYTIERKLP